MLRLNYIEKTNKSRELKQMLVERPCKGNSSEPNLCVFKITGCFNKTDVSTQKVLVVCRILLLPIQAILFSNASVKTG